MPRCVPVYLRRFCTVFFYSPFSGIIAIKKEKKNARLFYRNLPTLRSARTFAISARESMRNNSCTKESGRSQSKRERDSFESLPLILTSVAKIPADIPLFSA